MLTWVYLRNDILLTTKSRREKSRNSPSPLAADPRSRCRSPAGVREAGEAGYCRSLEVERRASRELTNEAATAKPKGPLAGELPTDVLAKDLVVDAGFAARRERELEAIAQLSGSCVGPVHPSDTLEQLRAEWPN